MVWIERLKDGIDHAVQLTHAKANLNELYNKIETATEEMGGFWVGGEESEETGDDAIIVHEWFSGRKKGILADFVIGTIARFLLRRTGVVYAASPAQHFCLAIS